MKRISNPRDQQVFNEFLSKINDDMEFFATKGVRLMIAKELKTSDSTVVRSLKRLVKVGAIKRLEKGHYKYNPVYITDKKDEGGGK